MRSSWVPAATRSLVNSALGRKRPRDIARGPRVGLSCHEHQGTNYTSIGLQGRVVETIVGDQAEAEIHMLAEKYIGQIAYPAEGDTRALAE